MALKDLQKLPRGFMQKVCPFFCLHTYAKNYLFLCLRFLIYGFNSH